MRIEVTDAIQLSTCEKSGLFRHSSQASVENRKRGEPQQAFLLSLSYFVQTESRCDNEQDVFLMGNAVLNIWFLCNAFQKDRLFVYLLAEVASDLHCATTTERQSEYLHNFLQIYHLIVHFNAQVLCPLKRAFLMQCLNNGRNLSHGVPLSWSHLPHSFSFLKEAVKSILAALLLEEGCDYIMLLYFLLGHFEVSPECLSQGHLGNTNEASPADI